MKSLIDDLAVAGDETVNAAETTQINPSNGTNYWLIVVVLLAIACLLLLVAVVKYYMKISQQIHAYYHISIEVGSVREINIKKIVRTTFPMIW